VDTIPRDRLAARLGLPNPYDGFPFHDHPLDLQGGADAPVFRQVLTDVSPEVVVEVGTWKGATAVRMAGLAQELGLPTAIVCVDTWLGSLEHLAGDTAEWRLPPRRFGYPTLYFQFLANVLHSGAADRIVPLPNTSANAARWLARVGVRADVVYLDASHEEDDVYQDLCLYWPLLRPGGVKPAV
jgi:hypothetical protein